MWENIVRREIKRLTQQAQKREVKGFCTLPAEKLKVNNIRPTQTQIEPKPAEIIEIAEAFQEAIALPFYGGNRQNREIFVCFFAIFGANECDITACFRQTTTKP